MNIDEQKEQLYSDKTSRDYRLDLIKAISISLVLILHLRPIRIIVEETSSNYTKAANFILDQIYLNSTLIAVPLFILTSLFLFFQKIQVSGPKYLSKRCKRLLEIFIFWSSIHLLIYYSISLSLSITSNTPFSWHIPKLRIYKLIAGVDPPLPVVGDSVFYFIFALILLIIISYLVFHQRNDKFQNRISVATIIIFLVYFEVLNLIGKHVEYWRLDNFIIYVPIAYFLAKKEGRISNRFVVTLYVCFLFFGFQDVFLRSMHKDLGLYARVSIVCGALAVFSSCLNLKFWKATETVKFLSRFSLGIFAVHKYWLLLSTVITLKLFQMLDLSTNLSVGGLEFDTVAILATIATILCTFTSVYLLNRSPFQKFIK